MSNLLALGPLPPPLTGTPISFEIFCEQAKSSLPTHNLIIIDASPKYLKQQKKLRFSLNNIRQALSILFEFSKNIRHADSAIIFGSNGYVITLAPALLFIAGICRTDCYFRVFGGSLDQYLAKLRSPLGWVALKTLNRFTGVIVETELLRDHFTALLKNTQVHYVPGYRIPPNTKNTQNSSTNNSTLKIAFVAIVKEDKGIFVLLEAMKILSEKNTNVELTVFGNIHGPDKEKFEQSTNELLNTTYGGVLDWREVIDTLQSHDALVLPTFYQSEGHPGVLIEAMMAGIPIVATDFRSIPELVTHNHNGLLVPPNNAAELANAIASLATDRVLLERLAQQNSIESQKFTADALVQKIVGIASPRG